MKIISNHLKLAKDVIDKYLPKGISLNLKQVEDLINGKTVKIANNKIQVDFKK